MATKKVVENKTEEKKISASEKKRLIAILLNVFLGWAGGHRFYTGKTKSAIAMMFTMGGFGMVWAYDLVMLLMGKHTDELNQPLSAWV